MTKIGRIGIHYYELPITFNYVPNINKIERREGHIIILKNGMQIICTLHFAYNLVIML